MAAGRKGSRPFAAAVAVVGQHAGAGVEQDHVVGVGAIDDLRPRQEPVGGQGGTDGATAGEQGGLEQDAIDPRLEVGDHIAVGGAVEGCIEDEQVGTGTTGEAVVAEPALEAVGEGGADDHIVAVVAAEHQGIGHRSGVHANGSLAGGHRRQIGRAHV